jgi:hypothetical protein
MQPLVLDRDISGFEQPRRQRSPSPFSGRYYESVNNNSSMHDLSGNNSFLRDQIVKYVDVMGVYDCILCYF